MARFVHLAPEKAAARIRRSGLTTAGVFCFPVLPSHTLTHQWVRELRRRGQRAFVGVTVELPDTERVEVGHYARPRRVVTAAEAVALLRDLSDPRGYEVWVPRRIPPGEIRRIRPVPPGIGWRYRPDEHGKRPCACPVCLAPGTFGAARIRDRYGEDESRTPYRELLARMRSPDPDEVYLALAALRRRGELRVFAFLAGHPDPEVRELFAEISRR